MDKKLKFMIIVVAGIGLLGLSLHAATLSRVKIGLFNPSQARVLNNVIGEIETAVNAVVIVDTNVTTTVTAYTPSEVGQLLVGGAGTGTNSLWVAAGLTTNDWEQLSVIAP